MCRFEVKDLGNCILRIEGQDAVGMYLVIGSEKAVLLDTGCGVHNIKEFVSTLTDKPVEVYLTHGHLDHAGGMYYFDEVHMSHKDIEVLKDNTKADRVFYVGLIRDLLEKNEWTEADICEERDVNIIDVKDQDKIDLGDRYLTAVAFPGHTKGSIAYLDSKTGYLFLGDACNNSTFMFLEESTTIAEYLESLKHIKEVWMPQAKELIICHDCDIIPRECIDDVMECCEVILNDTDDKEMFVHPHPKFNAMPVKWAKAGGVVRKDGRFGNIAYNYLTK